MSNMGAKIVRDGVALMLAIEGGGNTAVILGSKAEYQYISSQGTPEGVNATFYAFGLVAALVVGYQVGDKLVFRPVRSFLGRKLGVPITPK